MVMTESFRTALPVEQRCENSQFQQLTKCSRQHISPTTSKTTRLHDHINQKGLALCLGATLGNKAHRWVLVNTDGTPMPAREGRAQPTSTTRLEHLHDDGTSSLFCSLCFCSCSLCFFSGSLRWVAYGVPSTVVLCRHGCQARLQEWTHFLTPSTR